MNKVQSGMLSSFVLSALFVSSAMNVAQAQVEHNAGQVHSHTSHKASTSRAVHHKFITAKAKTGAVIGMRKFPYPYQAMLAIASDADHETLRKFNLIHEFLNTNDVTPMGKGLGLDISDSFFMYNGSNSIKPVDIQNAPINREFTYFSGTSTQPYGATVIDRYIHAGWLDTLHTYGDFTQRGGEGTKFTRSLAEEAIGALEAAGDEISVWIDHGNQSNVDNFGSYGVRPFYNYQQGANIASPYYHTDLLIPYGVKFVWSDQSSDVFGHYNILYPLNLPDGQRVWGFWRYTNQVFSQSGSTDWLWSVDHLAQQLTYANLAKIEWQHQYAILAQHLSADNEQWPLPENARDGLRLLSHQYEDGNILVARTSRLLQYNLTQMYLRYNVTTSLGTSIIHIRSIADPIFGSHVPSLDELRGVTFYTNDPAHTQIDIGDTPLNPALVQENPTDGTASSIEIKWFPRDTTNYAVSSQGVW